MDACGKAYIVDYLKETVRGENFRHVLSVGTPIFGQALEEGVRVVRGIKQTRVVAGSRWTTKAYSA